MGTRQTTCAMIGGVIAGILMTGSGVAADEVVEDRRLKLARARVLADSDADRLRFTRLEILSVEVARELSAYLGREVVFDRVKRVEAGALHALGEGALARSGRPGGLLEVHAPALVNLDLGPSLGHTEPRIRLYAPALHTLEGGDDGVLRIDEPNTPAPTPVPPAFVSIAGGSGFSLQLAGQTLAFPDVRHLDAVTAREIAGLNVRTLILPNVIRVDADAVAPLIDETLLIALELPALEEPDSGVLVALGRVASRYSTPAGHVALGGIPTLNKEYGTLLSSFRTREIRLVGTREVNADGIRALAAWPETVLVSLPTDRDPRECALGLPQVETLDVASARALADLPCRLDLSGLRHLPLAAAEALAAHRGPELRLRRLPMPVERAAVLLGHPGLSHPGITHPLPLTLARGLGALDRPSLHLRATVRAAPEGLTALTASPAPQLSLSLVEADIDALKPAFMGRTHLDLQLDEWTQKRALLLERFDGDHLAIRGKNESSYVFHALRNWRGKSLYLESKNERTGHSTRVDSLTLAGESVSGFNVGSELARFSGTRLDLSAIRGPEKMRQLHMLALWPGDYLDLSGLTQLTDVTVDALATWDGELLDLSGLKALDAWQLRRLREARAAEVRLPDPLPAVSATPEPPDLGALTGLSVKQATALARTRTPTLVVRGVQELSAEAALALSNYSGKTVIFPDLLYLDEEAAYPLSFLPATRLRMPAVQWVSEAAWVELRQWAQRPERALNGPLHLHLDALEYAYSALLGPGAPRLNIYLPAVGGLPSQRLVRDTPQRDQPRIHLPQFDTVQAAMAATPGVTAILVLEGVNDPDHFSDVLSVMPRHGVVYPELDRRVALPAITSLNPDQASALGDLMHRRLELPGVRSLDDKTLAALVDGQVRDLTLGVTGLSEAQARVLADRRGFHKIRLPSVQRLPTSIQDALGSKWVDVDATPSPPAPGRPTPSAGCGGRLAKQPQVSSSELQSLVDCRNSTIDLGSLTSGAVEAVLAMRDRRTATRLTLGIHGPLSARVAEALASTPLDSVHLTSVTDIPLTALSAIRDVRGDLRISGLKALRPEVSAALPTFTAHSLAFPDLARERSVLNVGSVKLTSAGVDALVAAAVDGRLEVAADELTTSACRRLSSWEGDVLIVRGAQSAECAWWLGQAQVRELGVAKPGPSARGYWARFSGETLSLISHGQDEMGGITQSPAQRIRVWGPNVFQLGVLARWEGVSLEVNTDVVRLSQALSLARSRAQTVRLAPFSAFGRVRFERGVAEDLAERAGVLEIVGAALTKAELQILRASPTLELRLIDLPAPGPLPRRR